MCEFTSTMDYYCCAVPKDRVRSIQPSWQGLPRWQITEDTKFDSTDFRNVDPRFTPENRKANQALVDLIGKLPNRRN